MIEKPPSVDASKPVADGKPNGNGNYQIIRETPPRVGEPAGTGGPIRLVLIAVVAVIAILAFIPAWIQKWLWMRQVNYAGIFWTLFSVRWGLFGAAFVVALLYLWINLRLAMKNGATFRVSGSTGESAIATRLAAEIPPKVLKLAMGAMAVVFALFYAVAFYAKWDTYLRFRYGGSFGLSDPLFGRDAGFYVFRLPFYELLQNSLTTLAVIVLLAALGCYAYFALPQFSGSKRQLQACSAKTAPHLHLVLHSGRLLGMGLLSGPLRAALLHAGSCLRRRLYRGTCDQDRLRDYDRRSGGVVRAIGSQHLYSGGQWYGTPVTGFGSRERACATAQSDPGRPDSRTGRWRRIFRVVNQPRAKGGTIDQLP